MTAETKSPSSYTWWLSKKIKATGPYYGAIVVFQNYKDKAMKYPTFSGHVGTLYGFMPGTKYIVLGGNQGDRIKFSAYSRLQYVKELKVWMHLEGFYFPVDYMGPKIIAPLYQSDRELNKLIGITSNSQSTR